jgi:hypothetical protein
MALVVPNTADVLMLKYILNQLTTDGSPGGSGGQRVLKLFSNGNLNPAKTTEIADITELSHPDYTQKTLFGASWTIATSTAGTNTAVYSEQVFNFSSGVSVYGYYVTNATGSLLWVERFSTTPFVLTGAGEIAVTPRLTLD